ncbi:MAG: YebC/PmpR family DNA-binding transcriptional regulator [Candidatus Marinimicrobia bacterium]|mgnify:FL=1|jgi:YebC/PmpR family DNA-binding regulatory protein|nr:YebC/PmpR family DNA-binding transcriptional regulator [Candidatus Neomarinimicrobiota bacterium]MBT3617598.1 YebC/PmpR family DNA-binding transcriptional regulator [Candidatus Neomarinimicrobiota bacterium]MBT3829817.1 YebC/PmpR family DNA-binding transcriptional regulator [Candidatus Neomarinimicrobiota bacterium]MBT3996813.1 YebC/PmpR family DNA-binding transcriptional regulator [Candidatus Neomarinimicrobiota bacterium]MBT4280068.1 YebC/PmpR family DNA-binding transcriptional regulator [
MSGHSKWSSIKRKKAVIDAKRGKIFTKLIREITIAARDGGGDEESNPRLRQAIINAKAANMPQDNMQRAIKKGTGELEGVQYEESTLEGYGPEGVAIFMDILSDNRKRTVAEVRHLMAKYGGNLGENGSVSWMFEKKGQIVLDQGSHNEDDIFESVIDSGAEDFETDDGSCVVTTHPSELMTVRDALDKLGFSVQSVVLEMIPKNTQTVDAEKSVQVITLLEQLEDHDDIRSVFTNFNSVEG